ncbi:DUF4865 family protein [Streptomyces tropicalis]|uniref:DUF4865 family protein n=1 Tax=Streptomyces tropicalis TaxID=3034234 RepID=A0ABT6A6K4_9ACTN|nr:DUF4865 family protein [Streptomyces tropicalis]MDF3299435.1 DUF4865 family protein [Streptomyces tropicalis]
MYAKQYEVTLPADYDMGIIRKRVADFGHILDNRAGLGLKAYVIRERGVNGSPVNQYAPFYLWNDTGAMSHFLVGGGGFQGIIRDFGRPAVHHWTGIASHMGLSRGATPKAASRRLTKIVVDSDPTGMGVTHLIQNEIDKLNDLAQRDGVHTAALAVDPFHWQLMRFILWEHAVPEAEDTTERYEVLHLSTPHLSDLPEGRHW